MIRSPNILNQEVRILIAFELNATRADEFYLFNFEISIDINQMDESSGGRICRFVTYDFPQYFAVVSRIRQELHAIGPEGGVVSSTVVPQVQAVFPQGALTKKIKVGLQVNLFKPRKGVAPENLRKISVNHVPKKKKFFLIF